MALPPPRTFAALVLQVLRSQTALGYGITNDSLQAALSKALDDSLHRPGRYPFVLRDDIKSENSESEKESRINYVQDLLQDLAALGLARQDGTDTKRKPLWRLARVWPELEPDDVPPGNAGGFGRQPPSEPPKGEGQGGGGDDPAAGDGGGGGIGQVLAHPYLFTVSDNEFDDALKRALGSEE